LQRDFLRSLRRVWRPSARSAVREARELRGRSVERLCHGFALELPGDHPGLDGLALALLAEPELAATAHKTTTLDLR
jgi:hypothetical protein